MTKSIAELQWNICKGITQADWNMWEGIYTEIEHCQVVYKGAGCVEYTSIIHA